jgi:hypothetical protein
MPYRVFQKVLKHKDTNEQFKIVSWLFIIALVALVLSAGYVAVSSSKESIKKSDTAAESAQIACEAVQSNNQILINYLLETQERAVTRIEEEDNPPYTVAEIKKSYSPLINSLQRRSCKEGREGKENGRKR